MNLAKVAASFTRQAVSSWTGVELSLLCPARGEHQIATGGARLAGNGSTMQTHNDKTRKIIWREFIISVDQYMFGDEVLRKPNLGDVIKWTLPEEGRAMFFEVRGVLDGPHWEWMDRNSRSEYLVRSVFLKSELL